MAHPLAHALGHPWHVWGHPREASPKRVGLTSLPLLWHAFHGRLHCLLHHLQLHHGVIHKEMCDLLECLQVIASQCVRAPVGLMQEEMSWCQGRSCEGVSEVVKQHNANLMFRQHGSWTMYTMLEENASLSLSSKHTCNVPYEKDVVYKR